MFDENLMRDRIRAGLFNIADWELVQKELNRLERIKYELQGILMKDYTKLELKIWEIVNAETATREMNENAEKNTQILIDNG